MTMEHQPPHLTTHSLVEAILGIDGADLDQWIQHLSFGCSLCWATIQTGVHIQPLSAYTGTQSLAKWGIKPSDPVGLALNRLTALHAPETPGVVKNAVWQPLLPRHRHALRSAHLLPFGFARLVLEESQAPLSHTIIEDTISTPMELAKQSIRRIPWSADETLLRDIQAWGQVALARAAHRQAAPGPRVRQIVQEALVLARQGSGDPLLAATLWELQSLPADLEPQKKIAHLNRAIELVPDPTWKDLRAELLAVQAKHQVWWPEQAGATCRKALELLGAHSPPCLRASVLDQLAAAELEFGNREQAQTSWLEAQRLTTVDENPVTTCERWRQLAHAATDPSDTAGFFRAAIAGYRTLQLNLEEHRWCALSAQSSRERQMERGSQSADSDIEEGSEE